MPQVLVNDIGFMHDCNRTPIINKIKYWQRSGWEVAILCTREAEESYRLSLSGVKYVVVPCGSDRSNKIMMLYEYAKRNLIASFVALGTKGRYDIIYSISATFDLVLVPFLMRKIYWNLRWCVVFDNRVYVDEPGNMVMRRIIYALFRLSVGMIRSADRIFTVSSELRRYLEDKGCNSERIKVTGNGVEGELILATEVQCNHKYDGIYVGRIDERKGIYQLIDMVSIVKDEYPGYRLGIMGRGEGGVERKVRQYAERMNVDGNISFLGFLQGKDKYAIIKGAKMFITLSVYESYGIALLEAVCSGKIAIAYDLPAYRNIYVNGEVMFVEKNDYHAAARQVITLMRSGRTENKRGCLLLERYSWRNIAERERDEFDILVDGRC